MVAIVGMMTVMLMMIMEEENEGRDVHEVDDDGRNDYGASLYLRSGAVTARPATPPACART